MSSASTDGSRPSALRKKATRHAWRRPALITILLAVAISATRWARVTTVSDADLYCTDELEMTLSALDRFAGVPPTSLNWPGTVQQMVFVPIIGADYLISSRLRPSPTGFVEYLGAAYRNPRRSLVYMRSIVVVISSIGLALLSVSVARRTGNMVAGALCAAFLTTNLLLWQHACSAKADATALGLLAAGLAVLLHSELRKGLVALSGVLVGLALASKMLTALALPLAIALVLAHARRRTASLLLFLVAVAVAFAAGCPYVLLDPLRVAKSVFGTMTKAGEALGVSNVLSMIGLDALGWPLLLAFVGALVACLITRAWSLLAAALLCLALAVALTMRAAVVFPRYYLSLVVVAVVVIVFALRQPGALGSGRVPGRTKIRSVMTGLLGLLVFWQAGAAAVAVSKPPEQVYTAVVADLARLDRGTRVVVPLGLTQLLLEHADSAALRRLATSCEQGMLEGRSLAPFLSARKPGLAQAGTQLAYVLNEEEMAFAVRTRLAAGVQPRAGLDLWPVAEPELATRFSLLTPEDAIDRWQAGQIDVLILDHPIESRQPTQTYETADGVTYWRYDSPMRPTTSQRVGAAAAGRHGRLRPTDLAPLLATVVPSDPSALLHLGPNQPTIMR